MGIYASLGIRPVINAEATLTRLGGSLMSERVLQAMAEAAHNFVDMPELQQHVGERIAELTNNEAAFVCTGAATGLFLTTLACMVGNDPDAVARWPHIEKNEIIVHNNHIQKVPYVLAVRQTGAQLVGIEGSEGALEDAFSERTAAVLYMAGEHLRENTLDLQRVVELSHAQGIPVVVDAAAQLPPAENLWRFTRDEGADLVIFSGGKGLRGPQASGLILGRKDLIEACRTHGAPNQQLGRPMKVGKEEMVGLLTALEEYLAKDHAAILARMEEIVAMWISEFGAIPGVSALRAFPNEAGQPTPRVQLTFDKTVCGLNGTEVRDRLWEGDPRIAVASAGENGVFITPELLSEEEVVVLTEQVKALFA